MTDGVWTGPAGEPRRYRVSTVDGAPVPVSSHGRSGVVYRARSTYRSADGRERDVAIKLKPLLKLRDAAELERRCTLLRQLDHPGLMRPVDVFIGTALTTDDPDGLDAEDFDLLWIATEWVEGTPLSAMQIDDQQRALRVVADLARSVQAMHDTRTDLTPDGIVHRDLKPSNVMIRPDLTPVVIDYGSAGPVDEVWLAEGTPGWLAPEVASGATARQPADRWGVGAIAHQLMCGRPPLLDGAACSLERLLLPLRASGLPKADAIALHLSRLLETDPARRPSDLDRWADDLDALRLHAGRRRRLLITVGAAAVVVAGASAWLALAIHERGEQREVSCAGSASAEGALRRPALGELQRAIRDLAGAYCVRNLDSIGEATAAHLSTPSGRPAGYVIASPDTPPLRLTEAEYLSYRRFPIWNTTDAVVSLGGYPTALRDEATPAARVIELTRGGLLIGPRDDTQLFWIPLEGRAAWEAAGGAGGWLGFPTSNPYFADGAIRQDFEGGYSTAPITPVAGPSGDLPYTFGAATDVAVQSPGAELAAHGDIENSAFITPGGVRWWVDGDRVRHWIADDAVAACLGVSEATATEVSGVAIGTLRLGEPATCSGPAR